MARPLVGLHVVLAVDCLEGAYATPKPTIARSARPNWIYKTNTRPKPATPLGVVLTLTGVLDRSPRNLGYHIYLDLVPTLPFILLWRTSVHKTEAFARLEFGS